MEAVLIPEISRKKPIKRGLGALIPSSGVQRDLIHCPIDRIKPMLGQPRLAINPEGLKELAESIVAAGVLQPVLLRKERDYYRLVAGERRWRASRLAGLETIPALIKDIADDEAYALALIENVQREDLTPMEEALACRRLIDEYQFTQKQLAKKLGKARSTIANMLRLLDLPKPVQNYVSEGRLTPGHARAVLAVPEAQRSRFAERIIKQNQTVREAEADAKICSSSATTDPVLEDPRLAQMAFLAEKLEAALQVSVHIVPDGDGARMEIEMESDRKLFAVASQLLYSSSAG